MALLGIPTENQKVVTSDLFCNSTKIHIWSPLFEFFFPSCNQRLNAEVHRESGAWHYQNDPPDQSRPLERLETHPRLRAILVADATDGTKGYLCDCIWHHNLDRKFAPNTFAPPVLDLADLEFLKALKLSVILT